MLIFEDRRTDPLEATSQGTEITLREYADQVRLVEGIRNDRRMIFGVLGVGSSMLVASIAGIAIFGLLMIPTIGMTGGVVLMGVHCLFSKDFQIRGLRAAKLDREAMEHEMLEGLARTDEQRKIDHGF